MVMVNIKNKLEVESGGIKTIIKSGKLENEDCKTGLNVGVRRWRYQTYTICKYIFIQVR